MHGPGMAFALAMLVAAGAAAQAQQIAIDPAANLTNSAMPMGIASYGISNVGADTGPYVVDTGEVVGVARINGLLAYNASFPAQQNLSAYDASLQLNAVVEIAAQGSAFTYWLQDAVEFDTRNMTYYYTDNVWNFTTPTANVSNATLIGHGTVLVSSARTLDGAWQNQTFYAWDSGWERALTYPATLIPVIALAENGTYPLVRIGYIENGSYVFYDNITIAAPGGEASILVTPYQETPSIDPVNASYYDAELVFGGPANQTLTDFEGMNATLWLGYAGSDGMEPFQYLATFGHDTGETAGNISVRQGAGAALVSVGSPDYNTTITLAGVPGALAGVRPLGHGYERATSTTTTSTVATTSVAGPQTASAAQGAAPEPRYQYQTAAGAAAAASVLLYLAFRSRRRSAGRGRGHHR